MRSWNRLSIRQQLIVLITFLVLIIQSSTFTLISWFDNKERQTMAIEQAQTMARTFNQDFIEILLNPTTTKLAHISLDLAGFQSVDGLTLIDVQNQKTYTYGKDEYTDMSLVQHFNQDEPVFSKGHWYLKLPIAVDGYTFGYALIIIDPQQYQTQAKERFTMLIWMFPVELLLALLLAWRLSARYTEPFTTLATAMQSNDIRNNVFNTVSTKADNEIKHLFTGYNAMISQIKTTTAEIRFQSSHDPLTGLLSRYGFETELAKALHNESHQQYALLKIDLDQFKLINDTAGFAAGDALLKMIAHHLHQNLPQQAVIARLDADDFAALLPIGTINDEKSAALKLLASLKDFRFIWEEVPLSTSASCGLVYFIPYEYTQTELMKAADSAYSTAKAQGRNKLHIYSPDDQHSKQLNLSTFIATQIKEALGQGPAYFELYAQAIVPLQEESDQFSYEILIRMRDHDGNLINPDDFLPTADHYNLMADIDSYVLWTYLETVLKHPEHVAQLHSVHINLAGSSLNLSDFQDTLKKAIDTFDFPWHKLEMEVTETSAVGNLNTAAEFINFFRGMGIGFALDDFGTGMSSFDYLKNLPFDIIKIDGSFVKDMHNDPVDRTVIRYIQEICDLKGQETVAEYIESEESVIALREIGVSYGQGYHLGKPKPLADWINPQDE
ncbi:MAG: hypothetical protein ISEC1_P0335 [Thiomicrorhabdus sp.]|nr:MAG: hypothetical protein ISEC1_P0335 [Thiomicrorhabdus sp.]